MKCLHSTNEIYYDVLGVAHVYERPCGRCIACLHNQHDAIAIRALETTKQYPQFVYDTLTFNSNSLPLVPVDEQIQRMEYDREQKGDGRPIRLSPASLHILRNYDFSCSKVPLVERDIIRNWLKVARERFTRYYGKRPDWKYLIYLEYGPLRSRPHFHLMFWNISKTDYDMFLGNSWKEKYGFTKPAYFDHNSDAKDRECITRYISKYVSKGQFESPLVKDGLLPKPFHFYSQGLGLGYILNKRFDFFRSPYVEGLKSICVNKDMKGYLEYAAPLRSFLSSTKVIPPPDKVLDLLSVYLDSRGLPHALPRYYKQKLLNLLTPNVFSYTIQSHLLARIELHANKTKEAFARSLGYLKANAERPFLGLGRRLFDLLCVRFVLAESVSKSIKAQGRKTQLANIYKRPVLGVNSSPYGVTSNFLALVC